MHQVSNMSTEVCERESRQMCGQKRRNRFDDRSPADELLFANDNKNSGARVKRMKMERRPSVVYNSTILNATSIWMHDVCMSVVQILEEKERCKKALAMRLGEKKEEEERKKRRKERRQRKRREEKKAKRKREIEQKFEKLFNDLTIGEAGVEPRRMCWHNKIMEPEENPEEEPNDCDVCGNMISWDHFYRCQCDGVETAYCYHCARVWLIPLFVHCIALNVAVMYNLGYLSLFVPLNRIPNYLRPNRGRR